MAKKTDHAIRPGELTGAASDPTYAGALSFMRRRFTKTSTAPMPSSGAFRFDVAVTNRPGARFGPQAIRRASAIFDNDPQYPFSIDLFADDGGGRLSAIAPSTSDGHGKSPRAIERQAARAAQ